MWCHDRPIQLLPPKPWQTHNENRAYPLIPQNSYYIFNTQKVSVSQSYVQQACAERMLQDIFFWYAGDRGIPDLHRSAAMAQY